MNHQYSIGMECGGQELTVLQFVVVAVAVVVGGGGGGLARVGRVS